MISPEWEKKFDELYEETKSLGYAENEFPNKENIDDEEEHHKIFKSFISQTHKDLVEAILEDIPDWTSAFDDIHTSVPLDLLKQSLRAKYLNNEINDSSNN